MHQFIIIGRLVLSCIIVQRCLIQVWEILIYKRLIWGFMDISLRRNKCHISDNQAPEAGWLLYMSCQVWWGLCFLLQVYSFCNSMAIEFHYENLSFQNICILIMDDFQICNMNQINLFDFTVNHDWVLFWYEYFEGFC